MKNHLRPLFSRFRSSEPVAVRTMTILELFTPDPPNYESDPEKYLVFMEDWLPRAELFLKEAANDSGADPIETVYVKSAYRDVRALVWDLSEKHIAKELLARQEEETVKKYRHLFEIFDQDHVVNTFFVLLHDETTTDEEKKESFLGFVGLVGRRDPELLTSSFKELAPRIGCDENFFPLKKNGEISGEDVFKEK